MYRYHLVSVFFAACILSAFYWGVVQPVLIRFVKFKLFARRDELRRMAIDGVVDSDDPFYREAERLICATIAIAPGLGALEMARYFLQTPPPSESLLRFRQSAPTSLQSLATDSTMDGFTMTLINSPLVAMLLMTVISMLVLFASWNSRKHYGEKIENYFDWKAAA